MRNGAAAFCATARERGGYSARLSRIRRLRKAIVRRRGGDPHEDIRAGDCEAALSQKGGCECLRRADGCNVLPPYLNDLEHDSRSPIFPPFGVSFRPKSDGTRWGLTI